jgi:hypothetical protein
MVAEQTGLTFTTAHFWTEPLYRDPILMVNGLDFDGPYQTRARTCFLLGRTSC